MTMHMPQSKFVADKQPGQPMDHQPSAMGHPLANPHVMRVIPFWMDGTANRGDIKDGSRLFEDDFRASSEAVFQMESDDVSQAHGHGVADQLYGRTGLYVVVDDLGSLRGTVAGHVISDATTKDGVSELVMESPVGLLIFAEKRAAARAQPMRLAA